MKPVTSADLMDTGKKNQEKEVVKKPANINWYDEYMDAVDHNDQLVLYFAFKRHTVKSWEKMCI